MKVRLRGIQRLDRIEGQAGAEPVVDGVDRVVAVAAADQPRLAGADAERIVTAQTVELIQPAARSREVVAARRAGEIVGRDGQDEIGRGPVERIQGGRQDLASRTDQDAGDFVEDLRIVASPIDVEAEGERHPRPSRIRGRHLHLPRHGDAAEIVPGDASSLAVGGEVLWNDQVEGVGHRRDALELRQRRGREEARVLQCRLIPAHHVGGGGHHGLHAVDRILRIGRILDEALERIPVDVLVFAGSEIGEQATRRFGDLHRRQPDLLDQFPHPVGAHGRQDRVRRGIVAVADHRLEDVAHQRLALQHQVGVGLPGQRLVAKHRAADRPDGIVDEGERGFRQAAAQILGQHEGLDRAADEHGLVGQGAGFPDLVVDGGARHDLARGGVGEAVRGKVLTEIGQIILDCVLNCRRRRTRTCSQRYLPK